MPFIYKWVNVNVRRHICLLPRLRLKIHTDADVVFFLIFGVLLKPRSARKPQSTSHHKGYFLQTITLRTPLITQLSYLISVSCI